MMDRAAVLDAAKKRTTLCVRNLTVDSVARAHTLSNGVVRSIDRYAEVVRRAEVSQKFSEEELAEITNLCCHTEFAYACTIEGMLLAALKNKPELYRKVRVLRYDQMVALVDLIERRRHMDVLKQK